MAEHFECRNCFHVGPLTVHGRCERCHSLAVISQEVIQLREVMAAGKSHPVRVAEAAGMWLRTYRRAAS